MKRITPLAVLVILACEAPTDLGDRVMEVSAPQFTVLEADVEDINPPGALGSSAKGINDLGVVVGVSSGRGGTTHSFIRQGRRVETIPVGIDFRASPEGINNRGEVVGGTWWTSPEGPKAMGFVWSESGGAVYIDSGVRGTNANAINDAGEVTGVSFWSGGSDAFRWTPSSGVEILQPAPGTGLSGGYGINDAGDVVGRGFRDHPNFRWAPFHWSAGVTTLVLPATGGYYNDFAQDVNDLGQVVGQHGFRAFIWTVSEGLTYLGNLGGSYSQAYAINDAGQVVGWADLPAGQGRAAFLWTEDDGMQMLPSLGGDYHAAYDINELGVIVGLSQVGPNRGSHAVVWTVGSSGPGDPRVAPLSDAVAALEGVLDPGAVYALTAKLAAAASQLSSGKTQAAIGSLGAFVNQLKALVSSGRLTSGEAQVMIDLAEALIAEISV